MEFTKKGYIVLCKQPEEDGDYFISQYDECSTPDIMEAEIFVLEDDAKSFIRTLDVSENYIYKPIVVNYSIKGIQIS